MGTMEAGFIASAAPMRAAIDAALDRYTSTWLDQSDYSAPPRLREAMRYSLLAPGKRLRPLLALMAAEACCVDWNSAIPAACAVEMIHAYSLIHDDLPAMDDDGLRRGRPTCHVAFDQATAILAGDALIPLAFELLASEIQPCETATACCRELAKTAGCRALVGGQMDDLTAEGNHGVLEQLENIHRRKTGALLQVSLRLGGYVAGANESQMTAFDQFGAALGLAFQITDDLLDCCGTTKELGKDSGQDEVNSKLTYPGILGVAASRERAEDLITEAVGALTSFDAAAENLRRLAQFVLARNH